ncbi:Coronin-2A [Saguinus oedipus]|uniref:Coronin-2A n=1 Tax=Saguinus oedipus TaxID=9490 RepID=A0ABQ9WFF4_SAGOE|nr:Coronin-2A [Saguinus oedipus]
MGLHGSECLCMPACVIGAQYAHVPLGTQSSHSSASLPEPILVSLRPGSELLSPRPLPEERPIFNSVAPASPRLLNQAENLAAKDGWRPSSLPEKTPRWAGEHRLEEKRSWLTNGFDVFECPPPKTENELLQMYYRQQEEIRRLRELLTQREVQAKQLELEIKNLRMASEQL